MTPEPDGPVWFDPNTDGKLIPSDELGDRPLDGYYVTSADSSELEELYGWAEDHGVSITDYVQRSPRSAITTLLGGTGAGMSVASALLLFVAASNTWFYSKGPSRNIRMQSGISRWRIHLADIWSLSREMIVFELVGLVAFIAIVGVIVGSGGALTVAKWTTFFLVAAIAIMLLVFIALSWFTRPKVKNIGQRIIPWRGVLRVGIGLRVLAVTLAVIAIPFAISYMQSARGAHSEAANWERVRGVVRITLTMASDTATNVEEFTDNFDELMELSENNDILALSFALDQMVEMQSIEDSEFEHIVITNPRYLDLWDMKGLEAVDHTDVPAPLQEEIEGILESWSRDSEGPAADAWYTVPSGAEPMQAIGTYADRGNGVNTDDSLIVVIDDPAKELIAEGVLDALAANGQLVFTDANMLRELVNNSGMSRYVASIDNVADQLLDTAQKYDEQARLGLLAVTIAATTLVITLVEGALLWTDRHRRNIFVLHSYGKSFSRIQLGQVAGDSAVVVATVTAGSWIAYLLYELPPQQVLLTALAIVAVYIPFTYTAHLLAQRSMWRRMVGRKN
ncbi:MAG: hypothetical protein ACTHW1_06915 [Ancrocorticia sp.]|uniref:hypothetical protein n=1 Tax=Ancrocorticia sp. TaxID=2593684 RepID=UPI003F908DBB